MAKNTTKKDPENEEEGLLDETFSRWGGFVSRNPCKVFWFTIIVMCLFGTGLSRSKDFEDQQIVWTPQNNTSILARDRQAEMFPSRGGVISALFEVKEGVDSLLTLDAFIEMRAFE